MDFTHLSHEIDEATRSGKYGPEIAEIANKYPEFHAASDIHDFLLNSMDSQGRSITSIEALSELTGYSAELVRAGLQDMKIGNRWITTATDVATVPAREEFEVVDITDAVSRINWSEADK